MTYNTLINFLAQTAILLPAFLISISFHEFFHALTAFCLGDKTAQRSGRLTLNPLAHLDLMGLFFLIIFKIGWASPVPINQNNFLHPRTYSILTALAGPFSNFILATISFFLIKIFPCTLITETISTTCIQLLHTTAYVNIMLGVFNLLPIPPLDGSHLITALLSKKFPSLINWLYRYSLIILLTLFMLPQTQIMLNFLIHTTEQFIKKLIF